MSQFPTLAPSTAKLVQKCLSANNIGPNALQQSTAGTAQKFAVVMCGSNEYKVSPGDVFAVQRIRATIGSSVALKKVMLVGGAKFTAIGRPFLENVRVICDVEENKVSRNVPFVTRPKGRSLVRWWNTPNYVSILRVREITYDPEIVGELDKYQGNLIRNDGEKSGAGVVSESLNIATMNYDTLPSEARDEFQSESAEFFKQFVPSRVQEISSRK